MGKTATIFHFLKSPIKMYPIHSSVGKLRGTLVEGSGVQSHSTPLSHPHVCVIDQKKIPDQDRFFEERREEKQRSSPNLQLTSFGEEIRKPVA